MNGRYQDLPINTTPKGLTVKIDDQKCTTPCTLSNVSKRKEDIIIVLQDGREGQFKINRNKTAWIIADIILSGPLFVIMDKVSGGLYELKPVDINLAEEKDTVWLPATVSLENAQQAVSVPTTTAPQHLSGGL
ncbi:MAG: hypothetical protein WC539_09295 [Nitrospirota bacterium]